MKCLFREKIIGDLFLENEKIKKALRHQHSKIEETIEFSIRMLTLLNSPIEDLGVSRFANMRREGSLQNERQELFDQLSSVQEEKEKIQQDHNSATRSYSVSR